MEPNSVKSTASTASNARHRSPAYPAFSLGEAIEKLKTLWVAQKKNSVHIDAALGTLGYGNKSGHGLRTIAALLAYGLLVEEKEKDGSRNVAVSKAGQELMILSPDDPDYQITLASVATNPTIYAEMISKWPEELPDDYAIKKFLTHTKSYNPDVVADLIRDFRETYGIANLAIRRSLDKEESSQDREQDRQESQIDRDSDSKSAAAGTNNIRQNSFKIEHEPSKKPSSDDKALRSVSIPLPRDRMALIQLPMQLTKNDFDFLKKYIDLMSGAWATEEVDVSVPPNLPQLLKIRFGPAIWHNNDHDVPVVVTGIAGFKDGSYWVNTDESTSGLPVDDIDFGKSR